VVGMLHYGTASYNEPIEKISLLVLLASFCQMLGGPFSGRNLSVVLVQPIHLL
jgi:hypothetical protein